MMVTADSQVVHYRTGAPGVRITGSAGEIAYSYEQGWRLWQHVAGLAPNQRVEMPWPAAELRPPLRCHLLAR